MTRQASKKATVVQEEPGQGVGVIDYDMESGQLVQQNVQQQRTREQEDLISNTGKELQESSSEEVEMSNE